MRIKRMTATFGGLTEQRLELAPGLNLIQAPNESGKSTWAGFLKAMLYGIDTRDRDKKGHLADKNRYQPWSGAPMEGELLLEWQGRDITIRRGPRGSVPFGNFSAVYTGTEEPVPGLTADTCGELLLGVGREVFERSAVVGQGGSLTVTATPELERRIAALVSSGQEDVSFSQAEGRLKEWLNRRRVNRSVGRIPQLEEALAQASAVRGEAEQVNDEVNLLSAERAGLARRKEQLEAELETHKALARRELNRKLRQVRAELAQAEVEQEGLRQEQARFLSLPDREELKRAQGDLALLKALEPEIKLGEESLAQAEAELEQARARAVDPQFPGMTGDEAVQKAERDTAEHQRWTEKGRRCRKRVPMLQLAGAAAAVLIAAGGMIAGGGPFPWIWLALAAYGALAAASLISLSAGKKADAAGRRVLERYGVQGTDEVIALARAYRERTAAADRAAQQVRLVRSGLSERQARRENTRTDLFQFVHSFAPEVKDLFGCSAALSLALNLEEREAVAAARLDGARRLYEALKAQGGREEPGGPGSGAARPHPGGDSRPAGDRSGGAGAGGAPAEHGAGPTEGGGGPRRPGCGGGEPVPGAGAARGGVSGHLRRPGGAEGGQRPASGALLPGAEPAGGGLSEPPHRRAVPGAVPGPGAGRLCHGRKRGAAPARPVPVQGDGGSDLSGGASGGVRPVPEGAAGPAGAG